MGILDAASIGHTLVMNFDSHVGVLNSIECVLRSMIKSLCGSSSLRQLSKSHFTKKNFEIDRVMILYLKSHNSET